MSRAGAGGVVDAGHRARRSASFQAWASRIEEHPLARAWAVRWDRRWAHGLVAVLDLAMLGALLTRPRQGFGFLLVACAAFILLLITEALWPCVDRRVVLTSSVVLLAAAVLIPPRNSEDVWSYAMYGHMVAHYHVNPYTVSPLAYSGDPWFWRVSVWWQDTRSVYGPVFTGLSVLGMQLAGTSAEGARLFFQALTAASVLAALLLLARTGADAGALAFVGLSPLMVVNVVNGAHNDALVGFAALAAVVVLARPSNGWRLAAGVILGLGALVKLVALLPAGALVLWLWRRDLRRQAVLFGGTVLAIVVAGYAFIGGAGALAPLQAASRLADHWSLWGWLGHAAPPPATGAGPLGGLVIAPVPKLWLTGAPRYLGTVLVGAVALLAIVAGSGDSRPSAGVVAAVLAFVLATSYIQPWYLAAMIPPLALQWRSRLGLLGAAYSLALLLAEGWTNSGGILKTLLRIPFSTIFPAVQLVALAALVALALRQLREAPLGSGMRGAGGSLPPLVASRS